MPNDRGLEMLRFCDEAHALRGTKAVERLERAIPETRGPVDHGDSCQALIRNWWRPERKRADAMRSIRPPAISLAKADGAAGASGPSIGPYGLSKYMGGATRGTRGTHLPV